MTGSRLNALDQALDIAGSLFQSSAFTLADEVNGYGPPLSGQTGTGAVIGTINATDVTITGLTGMTADSVGDFLQLSGASHSGNNGIFWIDTYISATSVTIVNPNAVTGDTGVTWTERQQYSLENDLNYARTDRTLIKGVAYYDAVPTYQRPTAIGTNVPANLSNIATKTTDAVAYNVNRAFFGAATAVGNTKITITSAGNLKHSDAVDQTGVPCFDASGTLFAGDWTSCYVEVVDGYTGSELTVLTGPHTGEKIFGQTFNGSSTSPNSVEVHFFSAPYNVNYASSATAYTWETGQTLEVNVIYGFNERLDQLDQNALRTIPALGILTDAALLDDINNILETMGTTDGDTSLSGLLTNTSTYYPFNTLSATPSVVNALNALNGAFGNLTYTGSVLTSGQTVTASLQALANSIANSTVTRTIERLAADVPANTAHTLPGGLTYTQDGTNNGQYLFLFTAGLLRDPGPASSNNDYTETSTTSVTFYAKQKAGTHINYLTK